MRSTYELLTIWLSYSVSRTLGTNETPSGGGGGHGACPGLFWSLGNQRIPYTQSRETGSISTKSDSQQFVSWSHKIQMLLEWWEIKIWIIIQSWIILKSVPPLFFVTDITERILKAMSRSPPCKLYRWTKKGGRTAEHAQIIKGLNAEGTCYLALSIRLYLTQWLHQFDVTLWLGLPHGLENSKIPQI